MLFSTITVKHESIVAIIFGKLWKIHGLPKIFFLILPQVHAWHIYYYITCSLICTNMDKLSVKFCLQLIQLVGGVYKEPNPLFHGCIKDMKFNLLDICLLASLLIKQICMQDVGYDVPTCGYGSVCPGFVSCIAFLDVLFLREITEYSLKIWFTWIAAQEACS